MQKLFRIEGSSLMGDKLDVKLPLEAARKIIEITGRLPIPEKHISGLDMKELMDAVIECLDADVDGDFISVRTAEGMNIRVFVE